MIFLFILINLLYIYAVVRVCYTYRGNSSMTTNDFDEICKSILAEETESLSRNGIHINCSELCGILKQNGSRILNNCFFAQRDEIESAVRMIPAEFTLSTAAGRIHAGREVLFSSSFRQMYELTETDFRKRQPEDIEVQFKLCETSPVINSYSVYIKDDAEYLQTAADRLLHSASKPLTVIELDGDNPESFSTARRFFFDSGTSYDYIVSFPADLTDELTLFECSVLSECIKHRLPVIVNFGCSKINSENSRFLAKKFLAVCCITQSLSAGLPVLIGCSFDDMSESDHFEISLLIYDLVHTYAKITGVGFASAGLYSDTEKNDVLAGIKSQFAAGRIISHPPQILTNACGNLLGSSIFSAEKFVLDEEVILQTLFFNKGIEVTDENMFFEDIKKTGPRGMFFNPKMLRAYKKDSYQSRFFDKKDVREYLNKEVDDNFIKYARREVLKRLEQYDKSAERK